VPFHGRNLLGVIIGISTESEFAGKLKPIGKMLSTIPVLTRELLELYREIAQYYGTNIQELLAFIIPKRAARTEALFSENATPQTQTSRQRSDNSTEVEKKKVGVTLLPKLNEHIKFAAEKIEQCLERGENCLVLMPDEHQLNLLSQSLEEQLPEARKHIAAITSTLKPSERYRNYLRVLTSAASIVIGTRSAALAPFTPNVVVIFDDGNPNFKEEQSPYINAREICLLRDPDELYFTNYVHSFSVLRLLKMGFLTAETPVADELFKIKKSITQVTPEYGQKLPSTSFSAIRKTLEQDESVLLLYPRRGFKNLLACANCREIVACEICESALVTNEHGILTCINCAKEFPLYKCPQCNNLKLRSVRIGTEEIKRELGVAFPNILINSSSLTAQCGIIRTLSDEKQIVVSTPGAEPIPKTGYGLLIIMDSGYWDAVNSFDGTSNTLQKWFYAASLVKPEGGIMLINNGGDKYRDALQRLDPETAMLRELKSRKINSLPPFSRVVSIIGTRDALNQSIAQIPEFLPDVKLDIQGPFPLGETYHQRYWSINQSIDNLECYIIKSSVKDGRNLAKLVQFLRNFSFIKRFSNKVKFILDPKEYI
jgi:primosomal protein N' (replication factor Y)